MAKGRIGTENKGKFFQLKIETLLLSPSQCLYPWPQGLFDPALPYLSLHVLTTNKLWSSISYKVAIKRKLDIHPFLWGKYWDETQPSFSSSICCLIWDVPAGCPLIWKLFILGIERTLSPVNNKFENYVIVTAVPGESVHDSSGPYKLQLW